MAELKKAYKKAMLSEHPDRGGSNESTASINKAYEVLKKIAGGPSEEAPIEKDWFYNRNEGHPLHNTKLPAMFTYETLLKKQFNIVKDVTFENVYSISHIHKAGGIYFQNNGRDYNVGAYYGNWKEFSIEDITDGGRRGKTCKSVHFSCLTYGADYDEPAQIITNPLREWFGCEISFSELFEMITKCIENKEPEINGIQLKLESETDYSTRAVLIKDGTYIYTTIYEGKSFDVLNPFTLREVYKPLKSIPEKFSIRNLVQVIVHGQFFACKQNYGYTDDYALDAALKFREGYISVPIDIAVDWHGERKDGCTRVSMRNRESNQVNFGKHSNESFSLNVKLDNNYPLVDLDNDILTIESVTQLELKAS